MFAKLNHIKPFYKLTFHFAVYVFAWTWYNIVRNLAKAKLNKTKEKTNEQEEHEERRSQEHRDGRRD